MTELILGFVERNPVWTLVYVAFIWWPLCAALCQFRLIHVRWLNPSNEGTKS